LTVHPEASKEKDGKGEERREERVVFLKRYTNADLILALYPLFLMTMG